MPDEYLIHPMTETDLPLLAEYSAEAFQTGLGEPWTKEKYLAHLKENFVPPHCWVIKHGDDTIAGLNGILITLEHGPELVVDTLVVKKDYRGKGLGKMLINQAIKHAQENNLVGLRLLSNPKLPSYSWYHRLGFEKSGWVELSKKI